MPCTTYTEAVSWAAAGAVPPKIAAAAASTPPKARVRRRIMRPSVSVVVLRLHYRSIERGRCTILAQILDRHWTLRIDPQRRVARVQGRRPVEGCHRRGGRRPPPHPHRHVQN